MAPFFSIIVPTYNRARMLRAALETVRLQTFPGWECFVVDDGSTDATQEVAAGFARDPRFRVMRSPENRGMNASRNSAIERAEGTFVTFLDSDDLWLPGRLAAFRERIEQAPGAGFVFSNAYILRFDRIVGLLFDPGRVIPEGRVPGSYAIGEERLPYVTTNVALRREAFNRWGLFRTEMRTLDTELYVRFLAGGVEVAAIREPLSVRRLHGEQLTDRYRENYEESMQALAASGAPTDEASRLAAAVADEVAMYLVKSGRPAEARAFLLDKLGGRASAARSWPYCRVPAAALLAMRGLRHAWLKLRYHPALAPAEYRSVLDFIAPLI